MRNNRFFLMANLVVLLFTACSDDDDQPLVDVIEVSTTEDTYGEGDGPVTITFTANTAFENDVTITYEVTGTAVAGEDYEALPGTAVLTSGTTSVTQNLTLLEDEEVEPSKQIVITITALDSGVQDIFIGPQKEVSLTITDNDSFPFENGILVLHEGNFFGGNASVSFVTEDLTMVTNGIFDEVNDEALGDTAQSMAFNGDLAYIVVNNSQTVEVVDRYTFESEGTVESGLLNPRYIAFANGKGYVTNWGDGSNPDDDYVAVIDLQSYSVELTISVPEGPEWIVANENTLYVAHQGGFGQNNIVSVIDATTNTVGTPITVADRPNSMQLVNDDLWVLSGGNPAWTGNETAGQLDKIDLTTNTVETTFTFADTEHPNYLSVDGDNLYYAMGGSIFMMDVSDASLPISAEITGVFFYNMSVNDGRLYGVDAKDFISAGSLEVYDLSDNSLLESLEVSLIPGAVYFNGSFEF